MELLLYWEGINLEQNTILGVLKAFSFNEEISWSFIVKRGPQAKNRSLELNSTIYLVMYEMTY